MIVPEPYWVASSNAATHSTPYDYDQRVPLVFAGAGIAPGEFGGAASPADLAPTLAQLIGVTLAAPDGRVLAEALRPRRTRTSGGLQEAGYNDR
jgi:predicted AlkP superfamily pyrophosphatase or phosphodiesterase